MSSYHEDTSHLTKTALSVFCDSPKEYYHQFVAKDMERKRATKEMLVGTVLHSVLLEDVEIDDAIAIYDESCLQKDGKLNWRAAAKFREEHDGKVCMKAADADAIYSVYNAIQGTLIYEAISQGEHFEKEFRSDVYGMPCKCKPDIACDMGDYVLIYDLKFMDRIHPAAFQRSARSFRYWLQDAHYSAVLRELTGKPTVFKFLAVEIQFPFRVHAYWYGVRQREIARDYHQKKVVEVLECRRTGNWTDNWSNELELNPWDVGQDRSEIELDWEEAA